MKKSIFSVLVVCLMVALMVGCNRKSPPPLLDGEPYVFNNLPSDSSASDLSSDIKDKKDVVYEKGVLTETGFESEYLNLRFTAPDGFIMATEEELNEMMDLGADIGAEIMDVDKKVWEYAQTRIVYEMMVSSSSGSPNLILTSEKLPLSNMTVDQYFDLLKTQLDAMDIDVIEYEFGDITSIEIAGQSYQKLDMKAKMDGLEMVQSYIVRKDNDRVVVVVTTSMGGDEEALDTLIAAFSEY